MTEATKPLLEVRDLEVQFTTQSGVSTAVHEANFTLHAGETLAIVGESGSGKSTTAMSVLGLLPGNGRVTNGSILFQGEEIVGASEAKMRTLRGAKMGLVPQDPMSNLNPVIKVGDQVGEALLAHGLATKKTVKAKIVETLERAGLPNAEERANQYPHEFSGGMRQRALIAIGLACQPALLIADEPTSALDVTVQRTILDQLQKMTTELGTAMLLITHDLGLAAERAQKVMVMYRGRAVETGPAREILENPQHPYTKSLVEAAPSVAMARLQVSDFEGHQSDEDSLDLIAEWKNVSKEFKVRGRKDHFKAVDSVSIQVPRGKTVSIVGESGSGKTTTARMLLKAHAPTSGEVLFEGQDVFSLKGKAERDFRQRVQPVFQDPYSSLNPMFTIERIIEEPLQFYKKGSKKEREQRVYELLDQVALPKDMARRYPSELSGGQRQRVAIARALALSPDLIVCDELVSALDVLVQDQILKLLRELQDNLGLSYLFISHDLAVVRLISDYVAVMQNGKLVEAASSEEIFTNPRDPYTRRLLASIPGNELGIEEDVA